MQLTIKMFNILTNEKIGNTIEVNNFFDVDAYAESLQIENPDFTIMVRWVSYNYQTNFINLVALNQKIDEDKYNSGEITLEEYKNKWFRINIDEIKGLKITKEK
jgi:hypothetical protein